MLSVGSHQSAAIIMVERCQVTAREKIFKMQDNGYLPFLLNLKVFADIDCTPKRSSLLTSCVLRTRAGGSCSLANPTRAPFCPYGVRTAERRTLGSDIDWKTSSDGVEDDVRSQAALFTRFHKPLIVIVVVNMPPKPPQIHVRVGVGVLVKDPAKPTNIFCGIRKGSHGAGSLALPGGHLEMFEEWADCAKREIKEEMGLAIHNVEFAHVTNDIMIAEHKHYVTIFMTCGVSENAAPKNMEPDKCEGWKSYSWKELKDMYASDSSQLFGPLAKLVQHEPQSIVDFLQ